MIVPMFSSGRQSRISVWLDNSSGNIEKQFHCLVCGKIVFEYYDEVKIIVPGGDPQTYEKGPTVIQCKGLFEVWQNGRLVRTRCKTKYLVG